MNRNAIIAIIIILIIAVVGVFIFTQQHATSENGKLNTQINFLSQNTLKNGEQVQFELKDAQGNPITNQNVNISYVANGATEKYSVYTDSQGKAFLAIAGENAGTYEVTVTYGGNEKYNGCTAKQTITIEDGTADTGDVQTQSNSTASTVSYNNASKSTQSTSSSSSSSSSATPTYYDGELNVYYDKNGKVIGGQSDGYNIYDLRNNPPSVDESGNLV